MLLNNTNKDLIGESEVPLKLTMFLEVGTLQTTCNIAGVLSELADVDWMKSHLGVQGALRDLIYVLKRVPPSIIKNVDRVIVKLCRGYAANVSRALEDGAIRVILKLMEEGSAVNDLVCILTVLANNQKAFDQKYELGGDQLLLQILRETKSEISKISCIATLHGFCFAQNWSNSWRKEIVKNEDKQKTISKVFLSTARDKTTRRMASEILQELDQHQNESKKESDIDCPRPRRLMRDWHEPYVPCFPNHFFPCRSR